MKKTVFSTKKERKYIISLYNTRSFYAMIASLAVMVCSTYAIVGGLIELVLDGESIFHHFRYFTTDSNLLTLVAICMIAPYAIEGYKKRDSAVLNGLHISSTAEQPVYHLLCFLPFSSSAGQIRNWHLPALIHFYT